VISNLLNFIRNKQILLGDTPAMPLSPRYAHFGGFFPFDVSYRLATLADTFNNTPAMPMPSWVRTNRRFFCPDDLLMTGHQQNNRAIISGEVA